MIKTITASTGIKSLKGLAGQTVNIMINKQIDIIAERFIINEYDNIMQLGKVNKHIDGEQEIYCNICKDNIEWVEIDDYLIEFNVTVGAGGLTTNYIVSI